LPSESLLTVSGIQHRVPRRTLSTHAAQAFTNAPRGTRTFPPPVPHCALGGDSWDAVTRGHKSVRRAPPNPLNLHKNVLRLTVLLQCRVRHAVRGAIRRLRASLASPSGSRPYPPPWVPAPSGASRQPLGACTTSGSPP